MQNECFQFWVFPKKHREPLMSLWWHHQDKCSLADTAVCHSMEVTGQPWGSSGRQRGELCRGAGLSFLRVRLMKTEFQSLATFRLTPPSISQRKMADFSVIQRLLKLEDKFTYFSMGLAMLIIEGWFWYTQYLLKTFCILNHHLADAQEFYYDLWP